MKDIRISVRNKIALNRENDTYVCGNSDYRVVFDFDEEWDAYHIKTARFKYNGVYQEVVFTGSECAVPIIQDARMIHVGVYAGNISTSTPAVVIASRSILCGDEQHQEPEQDVYNQLVALVEAGAVKGETGVTYTPKMDVDGTLSWENDGGRENPEPVKLKGPAGSDANVTADNINKALGFTPSDVETVNQLKDDLDELKTKSLLYGEFEKKFVSDKVIILSEKDIRNVSTDFTGQKVTIHGRNRFDIENASFTMSSYSSQNTITKENSGIKIVSLNTQTSSSVYATVNYEAEFDGKLYFSCDAYTDGDVRDLRTIIKRNDVTLETEYGIGNHVYCIDVVSGDVITLGFQSHNQTAQGNTVYYKNIMLCYDGLYDYVPYTDDVSNLVDEWEYLTIDYPTDDSKYTNSSCKGGGYYTRLSDDYKLPSENISIPKDNGTKADIISNLEVCTYNELYNGKNGVAVSSTGVVCIGIDGMGRTDLVSYLSVNPVYIKYKTGNKISEYVTVTHNFKQGEVIEFETSAKTVEYYFTPTKPKELGICFGDSITGMFGHGSDYPSIISRESNFEMVNAGFAGCRWTDHSNGTRYSPFCMNRLVDAIVSGDFSTQEASDKVDPSSSEFSQYYVDHLNNIKDFDFRKAKVCTIYYGVNDWNSSVILKSEDDMSAENKQRTNVEDSIKYCIDKLLTAFPNLKIIVVTPYWWGSTGEHKDSNVDANSNGDMLRDYGEYIQKVAENNFNVPVVNLYNSGANKYTNRYFTKDGGHPTVRMKHIIADRIIQLIN